MTAPQGPGWGQPQRQPTPTPRRSGKSRGTTAVVAVAAVLALMFAGVIVATAIDGSTSQAGTGNAAAPASAYEKPSYLEPAEEPAPPPETTSAPAPPPATSYTPPPPPPTTTPSLPSFEPVSAQGTGDTVVAVPPHDTPLVVLAMCDLCGSNFVVKGVDGGQQLLVNTIGHYVGQVLLDLYDGENTTQIQVTAAGGAAWALMFHGLDSVKQFAPGEPMATSGDAVFYYTGANGIANMSYAGDSNFIVKAIDIDTGSLDLLVNTIGAYSGTVATPGPAIFQITAEGDWSVVVT